jgi:hypothetical protein
MALFWHNKGEGDPRIAMEEELMKVRFLIAMRGRAHGDCRCKPPQGGSRW